jgi:hypothetical protein
METLDVKPCGWLIDHTPHHIVQKSTDSFNCPGYDIDLGRWKQVEFE